MKIAITGDVMLGRLVDQHIIQDPQVDAGYVWGDCLQFLHSADIRLVNLECVISACGEPWEPFTKAFHFRTRPRAIEVLKAAKVDFVSLANNHSLDYGAQALEECLQLLDCAGIAHAGAGSNRALAEEPAILKKHGSTVAVISITDNEPLWGAKESVPGVFFIDYDAGGLLERYRLQVKQAMERARESSCDIIIVSAHVGPNWGPPSKAIQAVAHQLIDMGVDCYWGHSNHTPQGIEIYRGKPLLYSTGDFIDDYAVDHIERNDLSFLFVLELDGRSWKLTLIPTKIFKFRANRVYGEESELVMSRMENASRAFGTDIHRADDALSVIGSYVS